MQGYVGDGGTSFPIPGAKVGTNERGGYVHSDPPGYYVMFLEWVPVP